MMATPSLVEFNRLIHRIYESAVAEQWIELMEDVTDFLRAGSVGLTVHFAERRKGEMTLMARFDPSLQREYDQYYAGVNIWKNRFAHLYEPGKVLNSADLCTGAELERTEWYNDFLRRANGYHSMGAVLERNSELNCVVTVLRDRHLGPFDGEYTCLELLTPHFQRALRIHGIMSAHKTNAEALEAFPAAVFLLDLDLRVRYLNQRAEALLRRNDGLAMRDERLHAHNLKCQRKLNAMLNSAKTALLQPTATIPPLASFTLNRPSGTAALQALALPAKLSIPQLPYSPSVLVCIKDPETINFHPAQLRQIFGFTLQEARLVLLLVRGIDLRSASQRLRISYETARKHLGNLRAKAGASTQADLVRLVLNGIAPVHRLTD